MTNSTINALKAVTMIKEKHPEARIDVIDSLCSSSGYGLLVDYALDLRDEGKTWMKLKRGSLIIVTKFIINSFARI